VEKKRPGAHLTTDRTALPAGEGKDFDMVCGKLEQYPHGVVEVFGRGNVISYG
jgi:hypothetical protein